MIPYQHLHQRDARRPDEREGGRTDDLLLHLAATGTLVRQRDVIAACGKAAKPGDQHSTSRCARKDNVARNPLFYLPSSPAATARAQGH